MNRMVRTVLLSGLLMSFTACSAPAPGTTTPQSTTTPLTQANTTAVNTTLPATSPSTTALQTTTPMTTTPMTIPPATTAALQPKHETTYFFIKEGAPESIDLDLDGTREAILLSKSDLTINSVSFQSVVEKDYLMDDDPVFDRFLVTDLNYQDEQIELVLMVRGPSDDPAAFFYTYKDGKLLKIGGIPTDLTDGEKQYFDGKGHITGTMRLAVLQTWFGKAVWELTKDNEIRLVPDQIFPALQFGDMPPVELKVPLPIYTNRGDKEPVSELLPQVVEFLATDNKDWVQIKGKDGKTGWFKVKSFDLIVDLNKRPEKVFANLSSAD